MESKAESLAAYSQASCKVFASAIFFEIDNPLTHYSGVLEEQSNTCIH